MIAEQTLVEIELAGNFTRGQCAVDWAGLMDRPANIRKSSLRPTINAFSNRHSKP